MWAWRWAAIDFGEDILVRAQELASRAGNPAAGVWSVENDILRSAWTFVGASIDTYFHERVRRALIAKPMSKSARKFTLPLGDVEDMVDGFLANRAKSQPRVRLNNVIHEALLKETFQGSRNVERAFGLAGVAKPWAPLATSTGDSQDGVGRLDRQYNRRTGLLTRVTTRGRSDLSTSTTTSFLVRKSMPRLPGLGPFSLVPTPSDPAAVFPGRVGAWPEQSRGRGLDSSLGSRICPL